MCPRRGPVRPGHAGHNIGAGLDGAGTSLADVVRTRMFVTDVGNNDEIGRVHGEACPTFRSTH